MNALVMPAQDTRLAEWFQKWRKPIRSWLRNRCNVSPDECDDLTQEVFVRLLRYSERTEVDNVQGYLFRIAANVANEWRERVRVRDPHQPDWLDDLPIDDHDEPENRLTAADLAATMEAAVNRLTPRQRDYLLLHVNDGLTYKQIAVLRGSTYRIVLRELTRSYSALRLNPDVMELHRK